MPRDALWVLPSGVTTIVTVDDDGNRIEDVPDEAAEVSSNLAKVPDPPPQQHRHRGRRNRR